ncbi:CARDB domain-containing protein [Natronosalvus vescus]|uniref:CARDB domain-containing protein n=1 Tax=Natronosalvus vescus TaxID=2953881 RepID=UPI00209139B5|nr:CARDB domain-containing protein [Natronosalvus vescus]
MTGRVLAVVLAVVMLTSVPVSAGATAFGSNDLTLEGPAEPRQDGFALEPTAPGTIDRTAPSTTALMGVDPAESGLSDDAELIRESFVLHQRPDRPGEYEAVVTYDVPEPVTRLSVTPESRVTVLEATGFEQTSDGAYEWHEPDEADDGEGDGHTLELHLRVEANQTNEGRHAHDAPLRSGDSNEIRGHDHKGGLTFAETGEWGIVSLPQLRVGWSQRSLVGTTRSVTVDGPGAAGTNVAYFGAQTTHERTVAGETIRLVVPEAADLRESPEAILDSLTYASEELRIGGRNEEVFVVAAPAGDVEWGANGIQYGPSDAWVNADARLDVAGNVWIHEYVHTRQDYARAGLDRESTWLLEAQAEYYAASLTYEQGHISYRTFRRFLEEGQESPYAEGILADPSTWNDPLTDYVKGPLVYGAIDRELHLETDGEHSMAAVFRDLNRHDGELTESAWLGALEDAGGADVRAMAETYTRTDAVPDSWYALEHRAAFGQSTPAIDSALAETEPIRVDGLLGSETLEQPRPVLVGETVTFPVAVDNRGDRDGPYWATVQVDGTVVDGTTGRLEAGESTVESLGWTPEKPGRYTLHVGDQPIRVDVLRPASLTVTSLEAVPDRVESGESVTVTATVENQATRVGQETLEFRTGSGTVGEETVTLAPGESTTVETTVSFDARGSHEVAVGEQRMTVTVEGSLESQAGNAVDSIPGFGVGAAAAAVVLSLVVIGRFTSGRSRR